MTQKKKKNRTEFKNTRERQRLRRWRLAGMIFLCLILAVDCYAMYNVVTYYQMHGKVWIRVDTAGVFVSLTVIAILNLYWLK